MAASEQKLNKIFDQNVEITGTLEVGGTLTVNGTVADLSNYLTSFTETDPIFSASAAAGVTTTNIANWNTAYGWGDHAGLYAASSHSHSSIVSGSSNILVGSTGVTWSKNNGEAQAVGQVYAAGSGDSRFMFHSGPGKVNVYTDGEYYANEGNNLVIHTGNIGSYALTSLPSHTHDWSEITNKLFIGNGFFSSDSSNRHGSLEDSTYNNVGYIYGSNPSAYSDGSIYTAAYNSSWISQIFADYRSGDFWTRTKNSGTWQSWNKIITSGNIGSYAPGLNGSYSSDWYANALYYDDWLRNHSNTNGLYWSTTGWHLHPYNSNDFTLRSGSSVESTIRFANSGNTTWGYIHCDANKTTGFLNDSRNWVSYTTSSGNHYATGSSRAPIFYDSNDTSYYTDPNGGSVFKYLNIKNADAGRSLELGPASNARTYNDTSRPGLVINADRYPHIDVNATSTSDVNNTHGAVISMTGKLGSGFRRWGMGIAQYNPNELSFGYYDNQANPHYGVGINWSSPAKMWIDTGGSLYSTGSMRSPVFYDYNDTNWWVDPNGSSSAKFRQFVQIGDSSSYNTNSGSWGARLNVTDDVHARIDVAQDANGMHSQWYAHTGHSYIHFGTTSAHGVGFISNNSVRGQITSGGTLEWWNNVSAPTYYDYDNTGYYLNAASTSNLYGLSVASQISGSVNGTSNAVAITGYGNGNFSFYQTSGSFDLFSGWHNYFIGNHGSGASYYHTMIAFPFWGPPRYSRREGGTLRGPYEFWTSERTVDSSYDIYAPRYYDKNNSAYYLDPEGFSNLGRIRFNQVVSNGAPVGDACVGRNYAYDTLELKGYGAELMIGSQSQDIHINYRYCNNTGNSTYTPQNWYWRAGTSTSWSNHSFGNVYANQFYDLGNTNYYLDPGSTSRLATVNCDRGDFYNATYFYSYGNTGSVSGQGLQVYSSGGYGAIMSFHRGGYYAVNMGLDSDNVLRIGGWSASANRLQLDMSGNLTLAGDVIAYSDARVKENIKTIDNALDKVKKARGVYYNRIDSEDKSTKVGVIAQEMLEAIPEVVGQDNDGMYNVAYGNIVGVLIEAVKELSNKVEELENKLNGSIGTKA